MIISKTPYRISFFGGGSDYPSWYKEYGGSVLSTTIDKYVYISCRTLPPFFKHKYRIVWSKIETVNNIKQIQHKAVKAMLQHYKIKNGLEIHYDGDLPARSGMGSSSVFVVGLMNLLSNFKGKKINKKLLAQKSIFFEQKILKDIVGSQDQIAASYGGFNKIKFNKNGNFSLQRVSVKKKTLEKLDKNLLLIYTGFKRTAHDIAKGYVNKLNSDKKHQILEISRHVNEAEKYLKQDDLNSFSRLMHESWLQKKSLSKNITNSYIDDIYNKAIKNGALGGKLLGAGGGGFLLMYAPYEKHKYIRNSLKGLTTILFKFETEGITVHITRWENINR